MEHSPHAQAFSDPLTVEGAKERTASQTLGSILPFLWPKDRPDMRARVVIAIACLFVGRSANVYGPIVLGNLVDGLERLGDAGVTQAAATAGLVSLALLYGAMVFLPALLTEIRAAVFTPVSEYAQRVLALRAFQHLHDLSMRFHLDRRTGGLSRAIERGTRALQQITGLFAFNIAPTLFEIAVVCVYLGWNYPMKYVGVILAAVAAYILFTLAFTEWRTKFRRMMVAQESRAMTMGVDSLLNFETVKYFGNERYEADRYNDALVNYQDAAEKSQTTLGILNGGQMIVRVICQVGILVLAIDDYIAGTLTVGEVVMLNTFMLQLFIPLGFLGSSYRMIRQSLVDMEFIFQILDLDPEVKDAPDAHPLEVGRGRVEFRDVSFGYDDRQVLDDVSFAIEPGQTVAIVGPSGAGKSTLLGVLGARVLPSAGTAVVLGRLTTELTGRRARQVRRRIGTVHQDFALTDSLRVVHNVNAGRLGHWSTTRALRSLIMPAERDVALAALDQVGIADTIDARASELSGGQRQRVAIARLLAQNPDLVLADEPAASLDPALAELSVQLLTEVAAAPDRALVMSLHDPALARANSDRIVGLREGEMIFDIDAADLDRDRLYALYRR